MPQDSPPSITPETRRLALLLMWVAVAVIASDFLLIPMRSQRLFADWLSVHSPGLLGPAPSAFTQTTWLPSSANPWWASVMPMIWWAGGTLLLWVVVPHVLLGDTPRRVRLAWPARARDLAVYGAMFAAMVPVLLFVGQRPDFAATYPLLSPARVNTWTWPTLLVYWTCYATILFGTEYLFRGVLLNALAARLDWLAVGVSVVPYALIHSHKPMLEAFAAIVAGWVLGALAWRTRSMLGGVLLHAGVAIGMDIVALQSTGRWPVGW